MNVPQINTVMSNRVGIDNDDMCPNHSVDRSFSPDLVIND